MTLTITDEMRAKAEIYEGDAAGQEKTRLLLQEAGLPSGLLPLRDIIECGYVEETGFVWLRQRRKVDHYFAKAGRHVSYGAEVSAVAEEGRLRKITGVKAKEMLIWVTLHEIFVDVPCSGKLHVKAMGGFSRSFPVDAFQAEGPPPVFTPRNIPKAVVEAGNKAPAGAPRANGGNSKPAAAGEGEQQPKKEVVGAEAGKKVEEEAGKKSAAAAGAGVEGEKKDEVKVEEGEAEEKKKEAEAGGGGVDKVEEKLKELSTEQVAPVQAEAVAAKN